LAISVSLWLKRRPQSFLTVAMPLPPTRARLQMDGAGIAQGFVCAACAFGAHKVSVMQKISA
jgi:hypothetical protein